MVLKMLQNIIFIPVDIFMEKFHNEVIQDEWDAWCCRPFKLT